MVVRRLCETLKQRYSQRFHDQIATLEQRCSNVNLLVG